MRRRLLGATTAITMALAAAASGCGGSSEDPPPASTTTTTTGTTGSEAGDEVGSALDRRVRDPLPPGAFVRFQSISQTPDPRSNHHWVLFDDGRLLLVFHSRDTEGPTPFDRPLPARPVATLTPATVDELRVLLSSDEFRSLPELVERDAEGGMWQVVTTRIDGVEREVVFDRARHPIADRLQQVATIDVSRS